MLVTFAVLDGVAVDEAIAVSVGLVVIRLRLKNIEVTAHEPTPATKIIKMPTNQLIPLLLLERLELI